MKRSRLGNRGAVLAEFAMAFMPIATMFLCVMQFSRWQVARIATYHAASVSARACAVIVSPNPGGEAINGPDTDVEKAAEMAMATFGGKSGTEIKLEKAECQHSGDEYGMDTATVTVTYTCTVPVAKAFVCPGGNRQIVSTAQMGHQGAKYVINAN